MIIITQRPGDTLTLAPGITVAICDIRDGATKCRLGIAAPRDVVVHRSEVYEAIRKAKGEKTT